MIYLILLFHWLGDFVLQTDWMAKNKSHDLRALGGHVLVYGFCLLPLTGLICWHWVVVNMLLHFAVDLVTSKITKYLYEKEDRHNFFVVIGFDQLLHTTILIYTFNKMSGG
jgi:membrane-bound metal-dependent hydrolase YbcI (DUF457 family)